MQTELIDVLVDFGASMQGDEQDSPLLAALIHGYPQAKRVWLKPGDKVATTIEKLGTLEVTLA